MEGPLSEKRSLPSPSSTLSDLPEQQPPHKRRRLSPSSETENKDEDEDEDEPLAVRTGFAQAHKPSEGGNRPQNHGKGLKSKGLKSKGLTSSMSIAPPTGIVQAEMNGQVVPQEEKRRIKIEDKLDESQLNRLATGVTVDTCESVTTTVIKFPPKIGFFLLNLFQPSTIKPEKSSYIELRKGVIQIIPVENDGQPRSRIILAGLKKLFQKQLPKMPREYIARLVFDLNSKCLAIIKRGYLVVGAICYRPFRHRGFAEIVFFATNSADQEKVRNAILEVYRLE
jgi:histone acetyltransferase